MSFDTLAPHYRWMERALAGEKLQRCRTTFLSKIPAPQRALLVGEGNGRFLTQFVAQFPQTQILCLDASAQMLAEARRTTSNPSVEFICADIFEWNPPAEKFDLIVTNFFLDCFTSDQLGPITSKLANATTQNAHWLLADFCEPPGLWKKWRARLILASMYLFFRAATKLPARRLTAPDSFLYKSGFALVDRVYYDWGLLHADLWQNSRANKPGPQ